MRRHPKTGERVLGLLRWGLIPHWSNDPTIASKTVNARGETVRTVPSFRDAYRSRRCLVPADAFYEWKATGMTKQPFAIALRDRRLFAFAGLWENWKDPSSSQWVRTFTILTTKPNELVAPLHDRMPLILAQADYEQWLDPTHDSASLIRPYPADEMTAWPISTRVQRARMTIPESSIAPRFVYRRSNSGIEVSYFTYSWFQACHDGVAQ